MASSTTLAEVFLKRSASTAFQTPFLMELQRAQIDNSEQAWPGFKESLRSCALLRLGDNDLDQVLRAIQSLAFVGTPDDLARLQQFMTHHATKVQQDARTAICEIAQRYLKRHS